MSEPHFPSPASPRWQRRPEARPDEILEAALTVFGESGFARAKIEDVARRAGVSKGTVYCYFDSKESLFREMVRAKVVASLAEAEVFVRTFDGSARGLLAELIRRMYGRVRREQMMQLARVVQGELPHFPELARFYFDEVILRARRLAGPAPRLEARPDRPRRCANPRPSRPCSPRRHPRRRISPGQHFRPFPA